MPVSYIPPCSFRAFDIDLLKMAAEQYCLKWTNYQRNVTSSFKTLLENEEFVDVSILSIVPNWVPLREKLCSLLFNWSQVISYDRIL